MRISRCIDKIVVDATILQVDFSGFYTYLAYITIARNYSITS